MFSRFSQETEKGRAGDTVEAAAAARAVMAKEEEGGAAAADGALPGAWALVAEGFKCGGVRLNLFPAV